MRKLFTLALSIVFSSTIFAAAEFFVRINSNGNFTVSLNNHIITSPSNTFRFFDLYPGNYTLKVYENGFNGRTLYNKPVTITDGYRTVAELDPYRGLNIIDKLPFIQKSWYIDNLLSPVTTYPAPFPVPPNHPYPPRPGCPVCGIKRCTNSNHQHGNNYPSYPGNGHYNYGNLLDDAGLQSLLQAMKHVTFEEKMLEVARTALKNRQVKTSQVHQLLGQFTFEQNKLDLAKYCYDKTVDPQNYYSLYSDFTFSSYSSELDKYINSR